MPLLLDQLLPWNRPPWKQKATIAWVKNPKSPYSPATGGPLRRWGEFHRYVGARGEAQSQHMGVLFFKTPNEYLGERVKNEG